MWTDFVATLELVADGLVMVPGKYDIAKERSQYPITSRFSRSGSLSDDNKDLRLLSIAMMTVDNGFEDQWWQQGPKEQIDWWSRGWRGDANSTMPHDTSLGWNSYVPEWPCELL